MPAPSPARPGDAPPAGCPAFLAEVKARIAAARTRAALAVNSGLIRLYREIGREILDQQQAGGWGDDDVGRIAQDLSADTGSPRGFSRRNLFYMRRFAAIWHRAGESAATGCTNRLDARKSRDAEGLDTVLPPCGSLTDGD